MGDTLNEEILVLYGLPVTAVLLLLLLIIVMRRRKAAALTLSDVIDKIAFESLEALVIPNGDDGEIQIDHLLLTAHGLLIIDVKDVTGNVFGSDKMHEWTVISDNRRFTFANPQPALYDRVAAVSHIVRQVPVHGRLVFLDGAIFSKGVPELVTNLETLHKEFAEQDDSAAQFKVESFRQQWQQLQDAAVDVGSSRAA